MSKSTPHSKGTSASGGHHDEGGMGVLEFEQKLHAFWTKNQRFVLAAVVLVVLGIIGRFGWDAFQQRRENGIEQEYGAAETDAQLQAFITAHPGHTLAALARLRLADEAYQDRRFGEAVTGYQEAETMLPAGPFAARARLGLAMSKLGNGQVADGKADLEKLAADTSVLEAVRVEANYQLLSLAHSEGKTDEVAKYADVLTQLAPSSPWTQRALALRASEPVELMESTPAAEADMPSLQLNLPGVP